MLFELMRVLFVIIGAAMALPAIPGAIYAASDRAWLPAAGILLGGLFGVWLACAGYYGTVSGRPPNSRSGNSSTLPNTR